MSIWSPLRGHAEQKEMFRRTIRRNRLSQAYLFVGPSGIGKRKFAQLLAHALLCQNPGEDPLEACGQCAGCKPFLAGAHPDFLAVGCPEGKRELPIALLLGPEERRGQEGLCHDLSLAPLPGSRKVAIVDDADTMNDASANAFLKTLEEPPERAILILIASNLDALLSTIRSRCQLVRFSPLETEDIRAMLIEQQLAQSDDDVNFAAALSEGSLTTATQLLEPELRELRTLLYRQLAQVSFSGLGLAKSLLEGIGKISSETSVQRINAQWLIRFLVEFFRMAVWQIGQGPTESVPFSAEVSQFVNRLMTQSDDVEVVGGLIERCVEAAIHVDQNVAVPLVLESLCQDLSRLLRLAAPAH
ncbi:MULTISPECIES: DNA polymerase III subunit delta' [unclassified Schlesneria]|uniref:DNA polymerase III subunit delta' n=1 Tax=Schlesneria TaxID=656899 RepID=UPI00359F7872